MELKAGMYTISKDRMTIGRLYGRDENGIWLVETKNGLEFRGIFWDINKISFDIIDLLEVGDMINKQEIVKLNVFGDKYRYAVACGDRVYDNGQLSDKEIVTKEQYESMVYRVGDEYK